MLMVSAAIFLTFGRDFVRVYKRQWVKIFQEKVSHVDGFRRDFSDFRPRFCSCL